MSTPSVLFVCVKNGGKSQMAAGLLARRAGASVRVDSAGTAPGRAVNALSAQVLLEVGVDIASATPKAITPELVAAADVVVVLGTDAQVETEDGTPVETWDLDEPSTRGIEGVERMRLVREDIAARVEQLHHRLTGTPAAVAEGQGPRPAQPHRANGT